MKITGQDRDIVRCGKGSMKVLMWKCSAISTQMLSEAAFVTRKNIYDLMDYTVL